MSGFFKRWSTLKTESAVQKVPAIEELIPPGANPNTIPTPLEGASTQSDASLPKLADTATTPPTGPQLADVEKLTTESDFSVFMNKDVAGEVHHAAMKKLFTDPHFNMMDGLDIYIDDYSIEDPLPVGMLEKMYQSNALGLFKPLVETPEANSSESPSTDDSSSNLSTDTADSEGITSDSSSTTTPLISHQESFEFTMDNSIEPTELVAQKATDLINTEVKNKDDHTRL